MSAPPPSPSPLPPSSPSSPPPASAAGPHGPRPGLASRLRGWARRLKRDGVTLWFACRDPATPWAVKALCALVVAYALSPIDLVPDFIPVLGYVDDVLLLPALIWLALKLLPPAVRETCRLQAEDWLARQGRKPVSRAGWVLVIGVWVAVGWGVWRWWGG